RSGQRRQGDRFAWKIRVGWCEKCRPAMCWRAKAGIVHGKPEYFLPISIMLGWQFDKPLAGPTGNTMMKTKSLIACAALLGALGPAVAQQAPATQYDAALAKSLGADERGMRS